MGAVVLDASIVIGFVQDTDTHHGRVVSAVGATRHRGDRFVLPVTVLSESLVGAHRAGPAYAADLQRRLITLFGLPHSPDASVADTAARLRAGVPSLRLPDAVVVATGILEDATVLTCDRRLAGVDERVQVLEP